jgi:RND family efflux transporter MFP subunit
LRIRPSFRLVSARPRSVGLSVLLVTGTVTLVACYPETSGEGGDRGPGGRGPGEQVVPAVEVVRARSGALPLEERLSGVVKAQNQVAIHAEIAAAIAEVFVRSGEAVAKGQPLVRLHDQELREQLRQTEAAVRLAEAAAAEAQARVAQTEAQVTRTRVLAEQQLISAQQLESEESQLLVSRASADQARARVEQARATADEGRAALAKTTVRAPIAGHVGQRNAEVGMLADRGSVLFVLGNLERVMVEIPLTEGMLSYVREGQPVRITSAALGGKPLPATLSRISPFLAAGSFSTIGEIDVGNLEGKLHPGMFVAVDVLYGESEHATLVPASALWEDPQSGVVGVYLIPGFEAIEPGVISTADAPELSKQQHPFEFRPVEVQAEGRSIIGVRGLEEGAWVVIVGHHMLREAQAKLTFVRATSWDRVLELQGLQREDILREFLRKQERMARSVGAAVPTLEEMATRDADERRPAVSTL